MIAKKSLISKTLDIIVVKAINFIAKNVRFLNGYMKHGKVTNVKDLYVDQKKYLRKSKSRKMN
jgi:hypothetical protein